MKTPVKVPANAAPLWCKSNYSFLEGASHPEELVATAAELGYAAIALTDRDGLYGVVRAHTEARRQGISLITGAEVTFADHQKIVLLACDREGYAGISRLISTGRLRSEKGFSLVTTEEVCAAAPGVIAIWDFGARVASGGGRHKGEPARGGTHVDPAPSLAEAFGDRLYGGISRHRTAEDVPLERLVRAGAAYYGVSCVAFPEVLYHTPARRYLQDVVTAIRHRTTLSSAGRKLKPNGQYFLRAPGELKDLYRDDPDLVTRTSEIARRCTFSPADLEYRYPRETGPDGIRGDDHLRNLTRAGAAGRYPDGVPPGVIRQLETELDLIRELRYDGYFLTMYEIVDFCRREGILCQGRGSAANSAVCFCLGITAVDPVRMDLLFERFLSRERAEPPDIDLDIEHHRREEVIRFMYERYGRDHAAMVANIVRYRVKSAIRDVGKALGISATALDTAARLASRDGTLETALHDGGVAPDVADGRFPELIRQLIDTPRHLSIHPGGFLLGSEPVSRIVPVENATMPGRTVIQWDKYDIEEMNLFKVDLLGLGALTHLDYCFRLLADRGVTLSMATIPAEDPATYRLLTRGDSIGVFQLESRAQMSMLPRLKPRTFYDLVIEISIIRPGPITGGMVHPYLRRRSGEEVVEYPHPDLESVLGKTLGVPLFQEQVMRVAVVAADYTPGEADQLRRDMAAWRRSGRIEKHRERIIGRMTAKGIEGEFAERVFEQIRGFGEYGFPESHAASFALIAYATAWMRTHHPAVFTCALLNAWPMGFYAPATIVDDARRRGVRVLPVDILRSDWECTLEPGQALAADRNAGGPPADDPGGGTADDPAGGPAGIPQGVRMGLRYVKGLGKRDWDKIRATRGQGAAVGAPFSSVRDVGRRTGLDERVLGALSRSGAFASLGVGRREALWDVLARDFAEESPLLNEQGREPAPGFTPLSRFQSILWDYRASIHSTRGHPLEPLREELIHAGLPDAQEVSALPHGSTVRYTGLVICRQRPGTAGGTVFITLEDETGLVNLIIWKRVYHQYRSIILMSACLGVTGRIQSQDGVVHVVVESCFTPRLSRVPVDPGSRDFH